MGKTTGFIDYTRKTSTDVPPLERIENFNEFHVWLSREEQQTQAARCMDCGVPFCQAGMMIGGMASGCPLNNLIPEWNDLVYHGKWELAMHRLMATNRFPEFTSRVCPALCEAACTCGDVTGSSVTVRENEHAIIETGYAKGWLHAAPPPARTGKSVAVVGSGPAGLVAANRLNLLGYEVTVFDRNEDAGGLLRYGIPNFKLNKAVIDRRLDVLRAEGITFIFKKNINVEQLPGGFDAYVIATGTPEARDLAIPGRGLKGIYFALDMLAQQNRVLAGAELKREELVNAKGKDVLVIGGGDTGSDCIGTAHRQGCRSVTQIEIMPRPTEGPDDPQNPWPQWPRTLKTTSSHEEGCTRRWNINTLRFIGKDGKVTGAEVQEITWKPNPGGGRPVMEPAGKPEVIKADMVLLAMGFLKPVQPQFAPNVFVCGDAASGASLVVRAMAGGRDAARRVDAFLTTK